MMKRLLLLLFTLVLLCPARAEADTWAVYWYLCGSNLETDGKAASEDLNEMLSATLPDDVTVVVQTGGAKKWHSHSISARHIGRYVYSQGNLKQVAKLPQANMGDGDTLASFLAFCQKNYPADHQVLVFWDHGNGSVGGLANDENFDDDALSLKELRTALGKVFRESQTRPPLEIAGFDACLMATIDTANAIKGFARYMVGSQELEPGNGWHYKTWLERLGRKTSMSGAELGKIICDTYMEGCREAGTEDSATLSLVDLAKLPMLNLVYNALGIEAVSQAVEKKTFYATFGRQAKEAENYMNSRAEGYTNMVDLGSLAGNLKKHLPEFTDSLLEAIDDAVLYKVSGPYRSPSGLSCYYPFDGNKSNFNTMMSLGNVTSFLILNGLQFGFIEGDTAVAHLERISNEISVALDDDALQETEKPAPPSSIEKPEPPEQEEAAQGTYSGLAGLLGQTPETSGTGTSSFFSSIMNQVSNTVFSSVTPLGKLDISSLEDFDVTLTDDIGAELILGPERVELLDSVKFNLAYFDTDDDIILLLGSDSDMEADWEKGVFQDNFRGVWPALDGHFVYLEITNESEACNHYAVPIKLNGERCNLFVVYDFENKAYRILGARRVLGNNIADKALIKLKKGDVVTTILKGMTISGDEDDFTDAEVDTFTIGEKTVFEDIDMGDGTFMLLFEMTDVQNNSALSKPVTISVKDGQASYEKD